MVLPGYNMGGHAKIFFECELSENGFHVTADNGLVVNEKGPALSADDINNKILEIVSASGASAQQHFDEYKVHKGQPIRHKLGIK